MDAERDTSIDGRVNRVQADFQKRMNRFFVMFAAIELPVIALAAVAIFGLELVDPEVGVFILVGIFALGGLVLSLSLLRMVRSRQVEIAQARGETP